MVNNKIKYGSEEGTTLVEMLVALSIFAIFLTVAIGGFIQALANQRLVLKLVSATDNMSMVLEQMMREMRVGTNFYAGTNRIQFDWPDTEAGATVMRRLIYSMDGTAISRTIQTLDNNGNLTGNPATDLITANNVTVSYFNVADLAIRLPGPCRVTMTIGITAIDKGVSITNYIQSTISSRIFSSTCQ